MRPFFSFYGSKWRSVPKYPSPTHDVIYEPFAGSAGYSTRNHERQVHLHDLDPIICGVWEYLIASSAKEILALPSDVQCVDDVKAPQEARWLIGFWLAKGSASPRKTQSAWMRSGKWPNCFWGEKIRARIASQVEAIKHWTITCGGYDDAPKKECTWFVDPPYERAGKYYRKHKIDYDSLSAWCRALNGQAIVCEADGATWLPFEHLCVAKAMNGKQRRGSSAEAVWTNKIDISPE